jgi:phosphatidylglycerol lysyltransferase
MSYVIFCVTVLMRNLLNKNKLIITITALITLGSGIINLLSVTFPALPENRKILEDIFPIVFLHLSRFISLLIGFSLIVSSYNIYKHKKRAFYVVLLLSSLSVIFHLTKGLNYPEALFSALLFSLLFVSRKHFTTKSGIPDFRSGLIKLISGIIVAFLYGIVGFWFLDPKDFGVNFTMADSIRRTLLFFSLIGDPNLHPHTHHAKWFLESLYLITITSILYSLLSLFRPVLYKYRIYPLERDIAVSLVKKYGRSNQDFFKYWPDKSFFFSAERNSFISYRVGGNYALTLGDPVGPEEEIETIIRSFIEMCTENDWGFGFHQVLPDFLPLYKNIGLRKLKIGDDAIVALSEENVKETLGKKFHIVINRLEKIGMHIKIIEPPISSEVLLRLKDVSDEWLQIQGRKERGFTLGLFDYDYIRETPVLAVCDDKDVYQAFINIIPSYHKGETTIDLMRRRINAHSGVMDYLFVNAFKYSLDKGFKTFNLGMAPMSGFQEREEASIEERAIHVFFQNLNFIFSYRGLRSYKAKFASTWEPRYLMYRNAIDLPGITFALNVISTIKKTR